MNTFLRNETSYVTNSVCRPRRLASHHQAEAVGFVRRAGGEVRVVQRRGSLFQQLPAAHAGPSARAESHGRPLPLPPVALNLDRPPTRVLSQPTGAGNHALSKTHHVCEIPATASHLRSTPRLFLDTTHAHLENKIKSQTAMGFLS